MLSLKDHRRLLSKPVWLAYGSSPNRLQRDMIAMGGRSQCEVSSKSGCRGRSQKLCVHGCSAWLSGGSQGEGLTVPRESDRQPLVVSAEARRLSIPRKSEGEHRFESNITQPLRHSESLIPIVLTPIVHCRDSISCEYKMLSLLPQAGGMGSNQSQSPLRWWPVAIPWKNSDTRVRNRSFCCCTWSQVITDNHHLSPPPPILNVPYLLTTFRLVQIDCQVV